MDKYSKTCVKRALKNKTKQGKFDEFISPDEGLLRETCKSQNINPILSSPWFTFSIIQIITNACQVCFSA